MPYYDYKCQDCGFLEENRKAPIDDVRLECPVCGGYHKRLLHGQFGINMGVGAYGYYDENLETHIESNRHKRQVMGEKGVTPKGDTPKLRREAWI